LSCGGGDEDEPPAPPGPVAMQVGRLLPRGSEVWKRGDAEPVVIGCDGQLGVTAFVYQPGTLADPEAVPDPDAKPPEQAHEDGDWLFRAPGTCGREQCGTLAVTIEPVAGGPSARGEAALDTVIVDLAPLGPRFSGRLHVHAELREDGEKTANYKGLLLSDDLVVDVTPDDCAPDGEGGAGGTPGTGGTGGSGGTGGASGGMGGTPGGAGEGSGGV